VKVAPAAGQATGAEDQVTHFQRDGSAGTGAPAARSGLLAWAALLLVVSVVFGGASRENPLRLMSVELASLPLAFVSLRRIIGQGAWRGHALELFLVGVIIAIPLLQLAPLPPGVWSALPGRGPVLAALDAAALGRPWLPISLAPHDTLKAALALVAPAAMFLAALQLTAGEAQLMAKGWIVLAVVGLGLGVGQLIAPQGGAAWLYATTNYGSMVGFFANRNHEASFLLVLTPFAAALAGAATVRAGRPAAWLWGLFILLAIVGLGVVRSRAGLILAAPAIAGSLALLWTTSRAGPSWRTTAAVAGMAALAVGAVALFALTPILQRFAPQAEPYSRFVAWPYVERAAIAHLPLGAGIGAFDAVYRSVEPLGLVSTIYFNHAHNDYLELWLEAGWVGAAVFVAFAAWFAWATWAAWRGGSALARASSIAVLLILAHSLVDYPLRTETLAVLFAFCCGTLAQSRHAIDRASPAAPGGGSWR
jgi:O-antigen ligase